jgi:SAM-dependent methyltransferase
METAELECCVCKSNTGNEHPLREMMFGTREEFLYYQCLKCGCLQIASVPENLGAHYPSDYYSFALRASPWKTLYYRAHFAAPRWMWAIRRCSADISSVIAAKPKSRARILDVGCGGGRLVGILRNVGFDAHGIDPFLEADKAFVRRASLDEVEGAWDLVMFHHSLEHMSNHVDVLRCARSKLAAGGMCIVRIPIATWAWEHYGKDWAQLDVPRHLVIHTPKSFQLVAEEAGLQIERTIYDSNEFLFYASELYRRGIPLHDKRAGAAFSAKQIRGFTKEADNLNRQQQGDQAAFFMTAK